MFPGLITPEHDDTRQPGLPKSTADSVTWCVSDRLTLTWRAPSKFFRFGGTRHPCGESGPSDSVLTVVGHSRRRTQAERRAVAEAALLRAAAELITEQGFERTSLRGIGTRAGTSRETPAYHFGSKENLITRLTERAQERTLAATAEALKRADRRVEDLSALEALRVTIETYLEVFTAADAPEERAVVVVWGATFPSDSPLPAVVDADRQTHRDLAAAIRAGQQDGSIRVDADVDAAAVLVMGMARGIAALSLAHPGAADPAKVQALCGEAITALLQDPSPTPSHGPETLTTNKGTSRPG